MSVNISISNKNNTGCKKILEKFVQLGIACRTIETMSVVDNKLENGCYVTLDKHYSSKKQVHKIWNIIKHDYQCAHLKIDGIYSGCIYDYIKSNYCPG